MGLKKQNYEIKNIGITLPEVYAVIKNIRISGERGEAMFAIQTTREKALILQPIKTVRVNFKADRNMNAYETAYITAKADGNAFADWQDDILTDNPIEKTQGE